MVNNLHVSGIYKIESSKNPDKFYIGSSIDIHDRWLQHKSGLNNNKHHSPILQNHVNKYSINDFNIFVLEICTKENLLVREQYYLDKLKPKLNCLKFAGNPTGHLCSEETKRKISLGNKGKPSFRKGKESPMKGRTHSAETRLKISISNTGKVVSQETRDKISLKHTGKKLSKEHVLKMSLSKKGIPNLKAVKYHTEESKLKMAINHPNRRGINQFDLDGNLLNSYISAKKASRITGITISGITRCCRGIRKTAGKYKWEYKDNSLTIN